MVSAQPNADVLDLSEALTQRVEQFRVGLPEDIRADIVFDFSVYTRIMLDMVSLNGFVGIVLVLAVLFFFLDLRSAIWAAFGIPFSFFGALLLFDVFDIKITNVTLATMILLLGIVVDDAIVIAERIFANRQNGMQPREAALAGVRAMARPLTASILTTMLAFGPLLFMGGVFGKFLYAIPVVVTLVLLFSWIESLFFLPAHLMHARQPDAAPRRMRWLDRVLEVYRRVLLRALERRWRWLGVYLLALLLILGSAPLLLRFLLEENPDADFFTVVIEAPVGTSLERTNAMMPRIEAVVADTVPEAALRSFKTEVGMQNTQLLGGSGGRKPEWAVITVYLRPAAERDIASEEIRANLAPRMEKLRAELGLERLSVEPLGDGLSQGKDFEAVFISNDDALRAKFESEALEFLKTLPGAENVESGRQAGKNEVRLRLDYGRLAAAGLTALDAAQTVRIAFDGMVATSIRREGEDVDFRVLLEDRRKYRAEGLLDLPIAVQGGRLARLGAFASLEEGAGPDVIRHYGGKRAVQITADVNEDLSTPAEIAARFAERFEAEVAATPGIRLEFGGQQLTLVSSMEGFYLALFVGMLSIYFLLVVIFDSYLQPALIMAITPFAAAGVFLALMLHGMPLTFIALMGMLGLIGVAVNDTIVMVSNMSARMEELGQTYAAIAEAAAERFRPVLLTTLTTFAGLLPTAYGLGGDLPELRPMVLTMAWGLVFATVVTLGFVPLLYSVARVRGGASNSNDSD